MSQIRQTHTYAVLELSPSAYSEIREKLAAAGYHHAFNGDVIDMHGIGVTTEAEQPGTRGLGGIVEAARSKF